MRLKVKIQLGVYDQKPEDMLRLQAPSEELFDLLKKWINDSSAYSITQHRLPDGFVHLIEWDLERKC
jgi:hypothetical protein